MRRIAASIAIATALITCGAWAWDSYYWTGATSTDFNTADNWNSNHVAVATTPPGWRFGIDLYFETADIVSYRIDIGKNSYGRGGWYINAGTEAQPLEFYCASGSTIVSPDSTDKYHYASGLTIASTCDSWVWINGGQWDAFASTSYIGSSDYAGHLLIGNDRNVDTLVRIYDDKDLNINQGSVIVSNATVKIGNQLVVGRIDGKTASFDFCGGTMDVRDKLSVTNQGSVVVSGGTVRIGGQLVVGENAGGAASFDFCGGTMVVSNYFSVKNSATFDLRGGSVTNAAQYLTVDASGTMTVRNGGRYSSQAQILVGNYSAGTLNIIDGGEAASGTRLAVGYRSGSSATVNIANGGILTVPYIWLGNNGASATVALDGGIIRAAKDERLIRANNNLNVTIGANGGTIDAAGYNVTIEEDLDNAAGATGAMTFKGGGTVTLSGAINYTGGTTVEAGTVVVVPDVAARTALGTISVTGLAHSVCEVVRLSGTGMFSAGDLPANTEDTTFRVSSDGKSILAANGMDGSFWIGGSGDLAVAANWSDGVIPTVCPTIKWVSPITLTNGGAFTPETFIIPEDSAVVTLAGALTVNTLTNATKLAVSSTGSLTVTGELVAMPEEDSKTKVFLYSNEGTVIVGGNARAYCRVSGSATYQYETVSENTQPIQANGIAYDCGGSGQLWIRLSAKSNKNGKWVVGPGGITYPTNRNANYSCFYVESGGTATIHSSADWTLNNTGKANSTHGDIWINRNGTVTIDTSDYSDNSVPRTITLKGRIVAESVGMSKTAVVIDGCGTVVVNTTGSSTSLIPDLQHTCMSNSILQVNSGATLQINAGKKITGSGGRISLESGATLALPAASRDEDFSTRIDPSVTLPAEGTATLKIDGTRLRSGDYTLFNSVPTGYAEHLTVTGTAIDGRQTVLKDDGTSLILTIQPRGLTVVIE